MTARVSSRKGMVYLRRNFSCTRITGRFTSTGYGSAEMYDRMRVAVFTAILVLSSISISSATFFGGKDRRGFFGFGYSAPAATPVIAVAHHHHHLAYSPQITKVAYAAAPYPYPEPVAKVSLAHHHPISYDVQGIPYPQQVIPYAAQYARIVYHQPEAVTKLAYVPAPVTKFSYEAQPPIITKFAYAAPTIKKFGYDW